MQKIFLIGNLTREPEQSETKSGVSLCKFTVAVNKHQSMGDAEQKTDFFNVTAWRGLGDTVARFLHKGNKVFVSGELNVRTYESREGETKVSLDVTAQEVEFLTPRKVEEDDGEGYGAYPHQALPQTQARTAPTGTARRAAALQDFDDDDIPF